MSPHTLPRTGSAGFPHIGPRIGFATSLVTYVFGSLSLCLYVCLSRSLSACLSVCLSVCLTDSMSVCLYRCHSLDTAFRAQPGLTSSRLGLAQPVLACTSSARLGNPCSIFASPLGFRLINDQLSCGKSQKDRQYRLPPAVCLHVAHSPQEGH